MHWSWNTYLRLALILIVISLGFGCDKAPDPLSPEERAWLKAHDHQIIVAAEPDWPPITFFEEDGSYSGIVLDYIHLLEERLGCHFQLQKTESWAEVLRLAEAGKIHVVMDVNPTPERSEYLNFTAPYLEISTVIITRKTTPTPLSLKQLAGKQVAITEDFQIGEHVQKHHPAIQLVPVINTAEALRRLSGGEFDAMIAELPTASFIIEKEKITNLHTVGFTGHAYRLAIGSNKNVPILASILEKGLALITENERREIRKRWISFQQEEITPNWTPILTHALIIFLILILAVLFLFGVIRLRKKAGATAGAVRWHVWAMVFLILVAVLPLLILYRRDLLFRDPLTTEERVWLAAHDGEIRFAPDKSYPPFELFNEENEHTGLSVDYIRLIERKLNFRFKVVRLNSWDEIINRTKDGKIDVISSVQRNPERSEYLLFTSPYIEVPNIIITRQEMTNALTLDTMQGMKVAVVRNYAVENYLRGNYPFLDIHLFPDPLSGLISVAFKDTDAMILDLPVAAHYIAKEGIVNLRMAGMTGYKENFRIASRKDLPILNRILEKGLAMISDKEREAIQQRWIHLEQLPLYKSKQFWISFSLPALLTALLIVSIIAWNRSLRKQVRERTRALKAELEERRKAEEELKVAKEQAESANLAKTVFLANISHEIRTPLNAVTGFSELLTPLVYDQKQKSYLQAIKTAGNSLLLLINDILDLSSIDAGMASMTPVPVCLQTILDDIEQVFRAKILEKSLKLSIYIDETVPAFLLLDEIRLRQILLNLVGNAVKFTDAGFITISATRYQEGEHGRIDLLLTVEDSGIGIPEDQQKIIFDSFVQYRTVHTQKYGGTGLGLSICKGLAEMMNGQISVMSTVNKGSTFSVLLRGVESAAENESPVRDFHFDPRNITFSRAKVVVVDDVESNRTLLSELLGSLNLDVLTAENGQEALLMATEYQPDVILMDFFLPVLGGVEATRQLKHNPRTRHIPVIAVTASSRHHDMKQVLDEGFDGYLLKPITMSNLIAELTRFLEYVGRGQSGQKSEGRAYPEIRVEQIRDLAGLLLDIEQEILPSLSVIQKGLIMEQVMQIGEAISQLGRKFEVELFIQAGEELVSHAETFDVTNIERLVRELSKEIEMIRIAAGRTDG